MVKLTPNVTDITEMALAAESAGADAVSLINTLTGMIIDINTKRPLLRNNTGGMSGAAVFPWHFVWFGKPHPRLKFPLSVSEV